MWLRKYWLVPLALLGVVALLLMASGRRTESESGHEAGEPRSKGSQRRLSRAARERLMQEIRETRARRTAKREVAGAVAAGAPPASPRKPGSQEHEEQDSKHESFEVPRITREYIRRQVSEIAPLLEECVEQSGPEHVDGKLQVNFIIDGEPGVGGLVRDAHIAQATFPLTPEFTRCVNETFMSIQVEPPEEGGFIKVRYPFYIQRSGRVEGAPPEAGAPG